MLKLGCWQVSKEDLGLLRQLSLNVLQKIANHHVDRVCSLILKGCELGLVGQDDDGYDCDVMLFGPFFDLLLETLIQYRSGSGSTEVLQDIPV